MLADIGGSLGLFIGASVLSFGEIIEVFGVLWNAFCRKKRNRTTMEDTRIHTVSTFLKFTRKIEKESKSIPLKHKYMTTHFPRLVYALQ
jgi:hypothetical protein